MRARVGVDHCFRLAGLCRRGACSPRDGGRACIDARGAGICLLAARLRCPTRSERPGQGARALRPDRAGHRHQREWRFFVRHCLPGPRRDAERLAGRPRTSSRRRCRCAVRLARRRASRASGATSPRRWPRRKRCGRPRFWRRVGQSRDTAGHGDVDAMGTHRHSTAARLSSAAGGHAQVVGGRGALVNARTCCSTAGDQSVCVSFVWKDHGNASG